MDGVENLRKRLEELESELVELRQALAERDSRIQELEEDLRRRGKGYRPKPNRKKASSSSPDRRRKPERKHEGFFRATPTAEQVTHEHDVVPDACPFCSSKDLHRTGHFEDHFVEDIPEPKIEVHRYRQYECQCHGCGHTFTGRGELETPGHIGPRARLLACYARGQLGISLGKTATLLDDLFGLKVSRPGVLGHLQWGSTLFEPVVERLLELLRESPVVHADETGWRIDGKNVWCWCLGNPQLAVFLIDERRSREVLVRALGESLPGVLVSDFYAAYNKLECRKQRCLVHLLRELHSLSESLPAVYVTRNLCPLIELFQDAITLHKRRDELSPAEFEAQREDIEYRFSERWWRSSQDPDCQRIYKRLRKHRDELLTFLHEPGVPPDNNPAERDIRSVAAARNDGGVNRSRRGATAFGRIKSVIRTCQKQGRNFFAYGLELVRAHHANLPPPLPGD